MPYPARMRLIKSVNPGIGTGKGFAVRGADQLRPLFTQALQGEDGTVNSIGAHILVLQLVEFTTLPGEWIRSPVKATFLPSTTPIRLMEPRVWPGEGWISNS